MGTLDRNSIYDLQVTSPDALPQSYMRLVGANATNILHTARGQECRYVLMCNDRDLMVNFEP